MRYVDAEKIPYYPDYSEVPYGEVKLFSYKEDIDNIPTADVQEIRHGKWHEGRFGNGITVPFSKYYICNRCNRTSKKKSHYCPNCGAKMDGKE